MTATSKGIDRKRAWIAGLCAAVLIALALAAPAPAQDLPLDNWTATAERAETLIEDEGVSLTRLEAVRRQLVTQRDEAGAAAEEGSVRARSVEAQIEALGTPPLNGDTEPEAVAQRRTELAEALAEAEAPIIAAREARERAELLIREIDDRIRREEASRLLTRLPTPLLPTTWADLPGDLAGFYEQFTADLGRVLDNDRVRRELQSALPLAVAMAVIGTLLIFVAEPAITSRLMRAERAELRRGRRRVLGLVTFAMRLAVPLAGLYLILAAPGLITPDLPRMRHVSTALSQMIAILATAHMLAHLMFAPGRPDRRVLTRDEPTARRGYRLAIWLGLYLMLAVLVEAMEADFDLTLSSVSALSLILTVVGIIPLYQLGGFVRAAARREDGTAAMGEKQLADDLRRGFALFLQAAAVLALVFACLGFSRLARQALEPAALTVGLVAVGLYLQVLFVTVLENLFGTRTPDEEDGALLLKLSVAVVIWLAAIPLLALIWGARPAEVVEAWRLLADGITVGEVRLSFTTVLTVIIVFLIGFMLTRWVQRVLRQTFLPRTRLDPGARASIVTGVGYLGLTLALVIAISTAGINLSSLAVVFGALSVGIGFGLQNIVSNFISGIILLVERPVNEGDWIEVSGYSGFVRKIAVRSTRIETFDRFDVIVPNSDLIAGVVKNMTLSSRMGRVIVPVGVAYGSDLEVVRKVLTDIAHGDDRVAKDPAPQVLFLGLGNSSLDWEVRVFLNEVFDTIWVQSDLTYRIYTQLTDAGVEIPFPQRDVTIKGLQDLTDALKGSGQNPA